MANYIWDLLQARRITPSLPAVEAYYKGLKVSLLDLICNSVFISYSPLGGRIRTSRLGSALAIIICDCWH